MAEILHPDTFWFGHAVLLCIGNLGDSFTSFH